MAHKLIKQNQNIQIHQALHGYVDGHREIASSLKLKPQDSKTMLILSDLSGSGVRVADEGYLTGYPLTDSGYYAIARTWPAPEMVRPGCVWTHTLLIEFADLANLRNARKLLSLFRRPKLGDLTGYSSHCAMEIALDNELDCMPELSTNSSQWVRQLLLALYGKPEKGVIATYSSAFDPVPVVLALWFQQWPRLRRSFCFCTSTTTDRSSDRVTFDLQLVPNERGLRSQFPSSIDVADMPSSTNTWLAHAFTDLECSSQGSLREFLRRVGGDVTTGRRAFGTLTILHSLIEESETQPSKFDEAITLLDDEFAASTAIATRKVLLLHVANHVKNMSVRALDFLVRNLDLLDSDILFLQASNIGSSIWMKNPVAFAGLFDALGAGSAIATSTLSTLSNESLIDGLQTAPELVAPVLVCRPDIVLDPRFWNSEAKIRNAVFDVVQNRPDKWQAVISAMINSGAADLAKPACNNFGAAAIWQVLAQELDDANKVMPQALLSWLEHAMLDKGSVAQVLANGRFKMRHSLATIAHMTSPDSVPNEYGKDPWVLAMQNAEGNLQQSEEVYLMSYLFSRALGSTSRSSAELAAISFDVIYRAAMINTINNDAWSLLNDRLPNAGWLDTWDRCKRLRQAVAELFLYRKLPVELFGQLSQDDKIFTEIAITETHLYNGKRYLKKVRQALSSDDLQKSFEKIQILNKLLS